MNFLILSPEAVYPPNTGGRIVIFNKLKYLKQLEHEVELLCIVDSDYEARVQDAELLKMGIICHSLNRNKKKLVNLIKSLFVPYAVASRTHNSLKKLYCQIIQEKNISFVLAELPQMIKNIDTKKTGKAKIILCQQNIEYTTMKSNGKAQKKLIKRFAYLIDSARLEIYEKILYRQNKISAITFVSDDDKLFFENNLNYNNVPTILLPIGAESHEAIDIENNGNNVIIVGKMSYVPNIEGVLWFWNNVWHKIKKSIPDAHLYIVGKDPDKSLQELASGDVTVTGMVDSVEGYYKISGVAVIPQFSGGGVKTKLIEASSYQVPIVCTSLGAKGTIYKNGEHILVSNDEIQFADMVIDSLKNRKNALERAKRCYKCFMENYQWNRIIEKFVDEISNL